VDDYLQGEHIVEINRDEYDIEDDCDGLRGDQQQHDAMCLMRVDVLEKFTGKPDVHQRDGGLLDTETYYLYPFHDLHRLVPNVRVWRRNTEIEDYDRRVKYYGVGDDHDENGSSNAFAVNHQIKAGIQNETEAGDIPNPSDLEYDAGYDPIPLVEKL
jgi:hypothetical protein